MAAQKELVRDYVDLHRKPIPPDAIETSVVFLQKLIPQLTENVDLSSLEVLNLRYTDRFRKTTKQYPKQVSSTIVLQQSHSGHVLMGVVYPDSQVVVSKRSPTNPWGADTWSVPMGKVEEGDTNEELHLGSTAIAGGGRELGEEVNIALEASGSLMAGSMYDHTSDFLIHVILRQVTQEGLPSGEVLPVSLPNQREHSKVGWIELQDLPDLQPMMPGSRLVLAIGLGCVLDIAKSVLAEEDRRLEYRRSRLDR